MKRPAYISASEKRRTLHEEASLPGLHPGDYVGGVLSTEEELAELLDDMVREAKERDEVLLLVPPDEQEELFRTLIDRQRSAGPLQLVPISRLGAPAQDRTASLIEGIRTARASLLSGGARALRVVLDLTWITQPGALKPAMRLVEELPALLAEGNLLILIMVDRRSTSSTKLLNLIPYFPFLLLGGQKVRNRYYCPPFARKLGKQHEKVLDDILGSSVYRSSDSAAYTRVLESRNTMRMLRSIIDSMGDGVFVTDAGGKLRLANQRAESILGVKLRGEVEDLAPGERIRRIGNFLPDKVTPYPIEELPVMRALKGESCDQVEIFIRNEKHTEGVWISTTARPLRGPGGAVQGAVLVFRDITLAKAAEEENARLKARITQAQKLESLGLLAGGIAHDFNNLLMGVLGNAGLALLESEMEPALQSRIEQIKTAAVRLAELTNQLLAYSGQGSFIEETLDLSELVREMHELLKTVISKRAKINCVFRDNLPPIKADATQLRQVTMNLITNASDALGGEPGTITVRTGHMSANRRYLSQCYLGEDVAPGEFAYLEVTDTGCGMDTETLSRIFDPFFTTKFHGRGLGLAAVLGLVRRHGGAVDVHSKPGQGTTFRVLFPAARGAILTPRAAEPKIESAAEPTRRGLILVVDDEPLVRDVAREMLERAGYEVITAENGEQGLSLFRARAAQIAAVILDITMPDMSGEQVYERMLDDHPDARVIISSGYTEWDAEKIFSRKKPVVFLQKPYVPEALLQKLERLLQ